MKKEVVRQLVHASGVFIVILGMFIKSELLILLCIGIVVFVEMMFKLDKHHNIPLFSTIFRTCKRRDDERGFVYFFIGIILTLYIFKFNMTIANAAILILLFGDSVSTLVGRRFGKHLLPFQNRKTFEGSLAFIFVGFLVAFTQVPTIPAFFGALFGMITEAYSPIDDNIPIPLISGAIISLVMYLI